MQLSKSESLFAEAQNYIPGGVNSPVRSFKAVGGTPPFIARGQGAHVWDVDGNRYVDLTAAFGVANVGHAHYTKSLRVRDGVQLNRLRVLPPNQSSRGHES
mgnify:CR=1 FL=1